MRLRTDVLRTPERGALGDKVENEEHSKQEMDEGKGAVHLRLCLE